MEFRVPGKPQGKARHRMTRSGHSYTPQQTVNYENLVKECYSLAKGEWFTNEPLQMEITACYGIPKSASKKDRERMLSGELFPTKKPDADNIAKIICDALNGVAYHDDTQIVQLNIIKRYTAAQPKVIVELDQIEFPTSSH